MRDGLHDANQNTKQRDLPDEQMLFGDVGEVVVDPEQEEVPTM